MSHQICAWCKQKIYTTADIQSAGKNGLCLGCLLSFIGGERPERRRVQRRRFDVTPTTERRFLPDRRRSS
jgi:hypothetical protein